MSIPFLLGAVASGAVASAAACVAAAIAKRGEREYEELRNGVALQNSIAEMRHEMELLQKQRVELAAAVQRYEELKSRLPALEARVSELELKKTQMLPLEEEHRQLFQKVSERRLDLERTQTELDTAALQLKELRSNTEKERLALENLKAERAQTEARCADARVQEQQLKATITFTRDELRKLETEKNKLVTDVQSLTEQASKARMELTQLQSAAAAAQLNVKALEKESARLEAAVAEAQKKLREIEQHTAALTAQRAALTIEIERLEKELKRLQAEKEELRKQVNDLATHMQGLQATSVGGAYTFAQAFEGVAQPVLHAKDKRAAFASEEAAIEAVKRHAKGLGFQYSDRVVRSFHTSLKLGREAPLLVLAGISGSGKSQLPRLYSDALGIHFLPMAVQPGWDSGADLVGYFSHIERKFKPTVLANALLQMDKYREPHLKRLEKRIRAEFEKAIVDLHDDVLLVLMDEMNLARVEYYFSDFLSRLEMRNSEGFNLESEEIRSRAELRLEAPNATGGLDALPLFSGSNVLFVGTMNEDESTMALSDKVVDRANVMRFGRPTKLKTASNGVAGAEAKGALAASTWEGWCARSSANGRDAEVHQIAAWLDTLNHGLDASQRPFAHRTARAIQAYCLSYPAKGGRAQAETLKRAFADQIEQRVMPKLRGLDPTSSGGDETLKAITEVVEGLNDAELLTAIERGKAAHDGQSFVWYGVSRGDDA